MKCGNDDCRERRRKGEKEKSIDEGLCWQIKGVFGQLLLATSEGDS